jgi:catalase
MGPSHNYHPDGAMRVDINHGSSLVYEPNSNGEWDKQPNFVEPPLTLVGAAEHWNHQVDDNYYSQPRLLFRVMNSEQQQVLYENTAPAMVDARMDIKVRHIQNCSKEDPARTSL